MPDKAIPFTTHSKSALLWVQLAVIGVFAGRSFQHLFWDAPFRTFLWDEGWMKGVVEGFFQQDWDTYITSPAVDQSIDSWIIGFGVFYALCSLLTIVIRWLPRALHVFLCLGSLALILLAALYCKEKFFSLGQFFEYALQFMSPLFLFWMLRGGGMSRRVGGLMKTAIAFTFVCHGLYAVNYYPRPGLFVEMTMNGLGVGEDSAIDFLNIVGYLDFVVSALILFLPNRLLKPALWYAIVWAFLTSVARVWAHFHWEFAGEIFFQWTHEVVFRFPHFMIPLALLCMLKKPESQTD